MSEMTCGLFEQGPVHHFPFPYSRVHVTIYLVARPTRACVVIAPPPFRSKLLLSSARSILLSLCPAPNRLSDALEFSELRGEKFCDDRGVCPVLRALK